MGSTKGPQPEESYGEKQNANQATENGLAILESPEVYHIINAT